MTILCKEVGLLFLENRNTGSTAIRAVLRDHLGGEQLMAQPQRDEEGAVTVPWRHASLRQLLAGGVLTAEERARLFVVSGVRDPFDLAVSEYARFRAKQSGEKATRGTPELSRTDFERFLRRRYAPGALQRLLGRRGRVPVDFAADADHVIRFERMQGDLDAALRRVGVTEQLQIPQRNVTRARRGRDHRSFYTPAARRIVERAYAGQLRRYGYRFEGVAEA